MHTRSWTVAILFGLILPTCARAADDAPRALHRITFRENADDAPRTEEGRILLTATDGGILLEDRQGRLWNITPDRLERNEPRDESFSFLNPDEMGAALIGEYGDGFQIVTTQHYVLCISAEPGYAEWVGGLFERLLKGFLGTWRRAGLELQDPQQPLVAIVFPSAEEYAAHAARDAGPALATSIGYFSVKSNRIVLYDLAGTGSRARRSAAEIERRLQTTQANVATIVHEATHQIAFNCGLHTRYADNPLWVTEGLAMYCEAPDLRGSAAGWNAIGKLNAPRLKRFRDDLEDRAPDALAALVSSDDRCRDAPTAAAAYAESWALTYFLVRTRKEAYVAYLRRLSQKPRLNWDEPDERLAEFEEAFGDCTELDQEFIAYIRRIAAR